MSYSKGTTPKSSQPQSFLYDKPAYRTFKIAHQRVSLEVDLANHSIRGVTDIILIPLIQNLEYITLDCKNIRINQVFVEGKNCENYIHDDPIRSLTQKYTSTLPNSQDILYNHNSVEQSHFLREKFASLNEFPHESTKSLITIKVPSNIKISLQDASTLASYTPITPSIRSTPAFQETVYSPISVQLVYQLSNPVTGLKFDTLSENKHLWNCYTTNSELCETASHWMPCVNLFDEKSTWEIEFIVPRKIKDIDPSDQEQSNHNNNIEVGISDEGNSKEKDGDGDIDMISKEKRRKSKQLDMEINNSSNTIPITSQDRQPEIKSENDEATSTGKINEPVDVKTSITNDDKTSITNDEKTPVTNNDKATITNDANDEDYEIDMEDEDIDEDDEEEEEDDEDNEYEDNDSTNPYFRDIHVVCSEFSTMKEIINPDDPTKKIVSFQIFNPVAPHHLGWAIGAFNVWTLPSLSSRKEQELLENELLDETEENIQEINHINSNIGGSNNGTNDDNTKTNSSNINGNNKNNDLKSNVTGDGISINNSNRSKIDHSKNDNSNSNNKNNDIGDDKHITNVNNINKNASQNSKGNKNKNNDPSELLDELETTDKIPIQIYTLPTQDVDESTVLNSTIVCQKIIDFFSKEFGSYPFTSYCLVFLPTLVDTTNDFASLSICNTRLLYPTNLIDPILNTTKHLTWSLANQWSGVNITPLEYNDIWCCIGMAGYMVLQFWKRLLGNNEFKYLLKTSSEQIVDQDWEKPPIGSSFTNSSRPISITDKDLEFIKLKAPMVLHILDRRMTKTERSFGMSRVLPKIFLQAMSGDLPNNSLSASHFIHVCEKVNKNKLEDFFQQWVYSSGVPIFRITQKFNKKRMVVEVGIRQVQNQELSQDKIIGKDGFCSSALHTLQDQNRNLPPFFTGSMTIRIHEADGAPYEHIVELKESFTKLDIQYNTKYKRTKIKKIVSTKSSLNLKDNAPDDYETVEIFNEKDSEVIKIQKLGNVLTSPMDCYNWNLVDFNTTTEAHEYQKQADSFEWIRIDSDFEWICKIIINQPDYMFASQLRQDGDVEAQLESIRYYEDVIEHSSTSSNVYSSILTRTIMDSRYFYGVRIAACRALSKYIFKEIDPDNFRGGPLHLVRIFQNLFCFNNSNIPKNNDFSDFRNYYLRKAIPFFLSSVRDEHGNCPSFIRQLLLDLLTYNENSENIFDDTYYICTLIKSLVNAMLTEDQDKVFIKHVSEQFHRYYNLEEWLPTYQKLVLKTIIEERFKLLNRGLYDAKNFPNLLKYSLISEIPNTDFNMVRLREGMQDISLLAFKILLCEGGLKNKEALKFFFEAFCFSPDIYVKEKLIDVFIEAVNFFNEHHSPYRSIDDDIEYMVKRINPDDVNIEDEEDIIFLNDVEREIHSTKDGQKRSHISGLLAILRKQFRDYYPLKKMLWETLHMPLPSLYQKKKIFDVIRVLYSLNYTFQVVLPFSSDRKLIAKSLPDNKVMIKKEGLLKVHLPPKLKITLKPTIKFSKLSSQAPIGPSATSTIIPSPNKIKITLNKPGSGSVSTSSLPPTSVTIPNTTTIDTGIESSAGPAISAPTNAAVSTIGSTQKPKKGHVSKPRSSKGYVNRVGFLPIRFVKIGPGPHGNKKVDISSTPFSKNVQIIKANTRVFMLKIKVPKITTEQDGKVASTESKDDASNVRVGKEDDLKK